MEEFFFQKCRMLAARASVGGSAFAAASSAAAARLRSGAARPAATAATMASTCRERRGRARARVSGQVFGDSRICCVESLVCWFVYFVRFVLLFRSFVSLVH